MALPKGVKSPVDYTKLYMSNELDGESINEKKEPKLPKTKSNVKSLNMASVKPGEPITAKARGMINRLLGGVDTSREDQDIKKTLSKTNKRTTKKSPYGKAYTDFKAGGPPKAKGLAKFGKGIVKAISKNPKGALLAGGLIGGVAAARAIGRKFNEIRKKRRDAAIDKQVDKYVADRKIPGGPKKVNYMPDNMYTVKRDKDGKVTGTGDQIRVVPGTRTFQRMSKVGDEKKRSRFSQHTRMKLGNYGSLSPMDEATMTPAQKRKDTMLKKKYEKSDDMMDSFKDQYGKKKGKEVFYAFIRKKSMEEENIQEILDKKDIPHVKKLVGKLRKGSKTHAKQADDLEKAMKENTAIESELLIQDWNKDDIKFTEIETVDIIKAKPLKESMSNWREDLGEDWQKVNRKDKTDGLSKKAVKAYRRENPGSKLQTAVTKDPKKLKKGSKDAKRRLSFCRRMKGMKKKLTSAKTRRDPDSRINKALRRWNC